MLRIAMLGLVSLLGLPAVGMAQGESQERIIAEAVSALPEPLRADAEVRAWVDGAPVTIREGGNGMICLGDDPADDRWHVACYHESLEPFMARGRQLRADGITDRAQIDSARLAEIESGALEFPDHPAALYSWFGDEGAFNPASGEARGARGLYVIYMPYATAETTGLSVISEQDQPWLMYPGKPWAHVMIAR